MSRIGKKPVVLPAGVKVEAVNGVLTVTGKKGSFPSDPGGRWRWK